MKRIIFLLAALCIACAAGCNAQHTTETVTTTPEPVSSPDSPTQTSKSTTFSHEYGVFLGIEQESIDGLSDYHTVVIDAQYFTKSDISDLHADGHIVYSYLNIGAIEDFRDYYADWHHMAIGDYENWPEEKWMDVTNESWQDYAVDTLAAQLATKGVDGFFLDNFDVYSIDERREMFDALSIILERLGETFELPLIINGADTFVTEYLQSYDDAPYLCAVNQENVFTHYDFDTGEYEEQSDDSREYYQEYLLDCDAHGVDVYLLEYAPNASLPTDAQSWCKENGFMFYVSPNIELVG